MDKVSVIIPTYNRFKYLLNTIESIKNQTYSNIEIIVVNDRSTEKEYYEYDWKANDVIMIHLEQNTKEIFGYACAGFVRNQGIQSSTGAWVAFCDDDDNWLPNKLDLQIKRMEETGCKMSCTESYWGYGLYDPNTKYEKILQEGLMVGNIRNYKKTKYNKIFNSNKYPDIFTHDILKVNNLVICSSVIIAKSILDTIGNMKTVKNGQEDYDCWLRSSKHTGIAFVHEPCVYYDRGHGYGQNY